MNPDTPPHPERRGRIPVDGLQPGDALRDGRGDAKTLLVLWCVRRAFWPLLLLGLAGASVFMIVVRNQDATSLAEEFGQLGDVGDYVAALLSPFAGVVAAFLLRILVGFVALAAAFPLSLRWTSEHYPEAWRINRTMHLWRDRLYLTRAYRAVRWTWSVRREAAGRAGPVGATLLACDRIFRWTNWVAFAVLIGVLTTA